MCEFRYVKDFDVRGRFFILFYFEAVSFMQIRLFHLKGILSPSNFLWPYIFSINWILTMTENLMLKYFIPLF